MSLHLSDNLIVSYLTAALFLYYIVNDTNAMTGTQQEIHNKTE